MAERVVWGLDIGQTALRAVRLERGKGNTVTMTGAFFNEIESQPDDPQHEDKVREALEEFIKVCNPGPIPVVLSLPGYTTLFRSFPMPPVAPGKLREVVSYEARQLIPYPLEEVQWDFQQLGIREDTGEYQVALMCCRYGIINNLLQMMDELGLVVEDIQVSPVALINYMLYDSPPEGTAMMLDCGSLSTDFAMFNDEGFWLRSIAVCGDDFSRTLMKKFNLSFEDAEQLKTNMADAKQAGRVFKVVEPVMRSLAAESQRSFGFYRSNNRGAKVDEMILAGRTFQMEGADQYMADTLGYAARTIDLPQSILISPSVDTKVLGRNRQVYGIAAGLALQGIGLSRYDCSLLPEARKLQKLIKSKQKFGWIAAALIVLTVLIGALTTRSPKPTYASYLTRMICAQSEAMGMQSRYDKKIKELQPLQDRNREFVRFASGRGVVEIPLRMVTEQIEALNNFLAARMNPLPVKGLPLDQLKKNLLQNISTSSNTTYKNEYDSLLKTKRLEFQIDQQTDEQIKQKMTANLTDQILRRVGMMYDRVDQTFLTEQRYWMGKAEKVTENGLETWKIDGAPIAGGQKSGGAEEPFDPSMMAPVTAAPTADGAPVEDTKKDVVVVLVSGYTVTQEIRSMQLLKERLSALSDRGLHLAEYGPIENGFKVSRKADGTPDYNTINLPVIIDPTPKTADIDKAGEGGMVDHSEKISYETYPNEVVIRFKAAFVYEPVGGMNADPKSVEQIVESAVKALPEPKKKDEGFDGLPADLQ